MLIHEPDFADGPHTTNMMLYISGSFSEGWSHYEGVSIAVLQPLHNLVDARSLPQLNIWPCAFHLDFTTATLGTAADEKAVGHK